MPASDTFHLGIPSLPESGVIGANLVDFFEMSEMVVKLDDITDTYSTGLTVLTQTPPDVLLSKLSWRVLAPFLGNSEGCHIVLDFGDTTAATVNMFGTLNSGQLNSTNCYGEIPINYAATGSDGLTIGVFLHERALGSTCSSGTLEIYLHYRYNPSRDRLGGKRAK